MAAAELTATVTATAATNDKQRRPATTNNTRMIRPNLGYVRPENGRSFDGSTQREPGLRTSGACP